MIFRPQSKYSNRMKSIVFGASGPYGFLEVLLAQTLRYGGTGAPGVYLPYRLTLRVYRKGQFVIHNSMAVLLQPASGITFFYDIAFGITSSLC